MDGGETGGRGEAIRDRKSFLYTLSLAFEPGSSEKKGI